jgi:uncharacterized protein
MVPGLFRSPLRNLAIVAALLSVRTVALAAPSVAITTVTEDGLFAEIHSPAEAGVYPGLVVLGGSEGGLEWARITADELAIHGYVAMALAYFRSPGLPTELEKVPLEYFKLAVSRLAASRNVNPEHLGIVGFSKGAEAALLIASEDARLTAVVAASPSDVAWQAVDETSGQSTSSWTQEGRPLAYVPFVPCEECTVLGDLYGKSRKAAQQPGKARIAVENINGPLLLISGGVDKVWPSASMSDSIESSMRAANFPYYLKKLVYPEAGHFIFGPPPSEEDVVEDAEFGGGTVSSIASARTDSWFRMLAFLAGALRA